MSKQLRARVTAAEYESAVARAQTTTKFANHAQIAEAIVERLREELPDTVSALIRVACSLSGSPSDTSELLIRVRVRDNAEEAIVTDFLETYQRKRNLAADIAARLRDRAPLLHPAELFRAVVGLPPAKVGAPEGNRNATKLDR